MPTQIIDQGVEQTQFATGGKREIISGKGRFDLLTPESFTELAQHFEGGAIKYADRNWEKGLPLSSFYNSGMRHFRDSFHLGLTNENHEAANLWNSWCYLTTLRRIQTGVYPCELDDRPIDHNNKNHSNCTKVAKLFPGIEA